MHQEFNYTKVNVEDEVFFAWDNIKDENTFNSMKDWLYEILNVEKGDNLYLFSLKTEITTYGDEQAIEARMGEFINCITNWVYNDNQKHFVDCLCVNNYKRKHYKKRAPMEYYYEDYDVLYNMFHSIINFKNIKLDTLKNRLSDTEMGDIKLVFDDYRRKEGEKYPHPWKNRFYIEKIKDTTKVLSELCEQYENNIWDLNINQNDKMRFFKFRFIPPCLVF